WRRRDDLRGLRPLAEARAMTPDRLDMVIKVSFATMILGVGYSQFVPESSSAVALLVWLAAMAGIAVAGFWRARLVRNARMPPVAVSGGVAHPAIPPMGQALFVGPPNPNLAPSGGR